MNEPTYLIYRSANERYYHIPYGQMEHMSYEFTGDDEPRALVDTVYFRHPHPILRHDTV